MLTSREFEKSTKKHTIVDGIQVISLDVKYSQKMNFIKRVYSFINFSFRSLIESIKISHKIDLVYATSTPLTVGIPALFLHYFFAKKYIFEVRDLWPEVPIQLEIIKNKTLILFLKKFEKLIYKKASSIIALSPGMYQGVLDVIGDKSKISMIPNMSKKSEFYPRKKDNNIIKKFNIDSKCLNFLYFGSIGHANGLYKLVEFFGRMNSNFHLYIAGSGSEENNLINLIRKENINNVSIIGNFNTPDISNILNCCDISIVSFLDIPILSTNSPNKFFDSLSAGKPILVNSDGWTRKLVEKQKCGLYYKYDDFKDFKKVLEKLHLDKAILAPMGESSLNLSNSLYDKEILTLKVLDIVNKF
jgi:glycosyltransferase involved in cell wall biosynthesis